MSITESGVDTVTVIIDGISVDVPKGSLIIRAAEEIGVAIPRFCDHPLLAPLGACRQCLVEVEGQRKPVAACTTTVADGMVVATQATSAVAEKAQAGTLELLLANHPLDCPVCDKGGECPLQNQALSNGRPESRFVEAKRTYPKPIPISSQVLLDRERCVLCARCTRFSSQIAGDPFIDLFERGAHEKVSTDPDTPFQSYFSGNTVQICPVGALTGASYRFRARPFDLVSTPSVCEHCASGCSMRTDHRRGAVTRRLAGDDPAVNEEWNCDKGRWGFTYATQSDRLTTPLIRDDNGRLVAASWPEALDRAAQGLARAKDNGGVGVLPGGRLTVEDAYAWSKFTRLALGTNDVDFRSRPSSAEEPDFLAAHVAGTGMGVTYSDLEAAPAVALVAFEPEDESPIVLLRLRKASRAGTSVFSVGPIATRGLAKVKGRLIACLPGGEAHALDAIDANSEAGAALAQAGSVILVGERAAQAPGALAAAVRLAERTGARLAWVPRRAGDRGAVETGLLPCLLPGGRPVTDAAAVADLAGHWGSELPTAVGRDAHEIVAAAAAGELGGLLIGGVGTDDLPADLLRQALEQSLFTVALELRATAIVDMADVVLPVAAVAEKSGTFLDWEGRPRTFEAALPASDRIADHRVLHMLADEMGVSLGTADTATTRAEIARVGAWSGPRPTVAGTSAPVTPAPEGHALLATWKQLLGAGAMQDGDEHLAGTEREAVAAISSTVAAWMGLTDGQPITITVGGTDLTVPVAIRDVVDGAVWLPANARSLGSLGALGARWGDVVSVRAGGEQ